MIAVLQRTNLHKVTRNDCYASQNKPSQGILEMVAVAQRTKLHKVTRNDCCDAKNKPSQGD